MTRSVSRWPTGSEWIRAASRRPDARTARATSRGLRPVAPPLTSHLNYGRGINSSDARAVVQMAGQRRVATTDFYQFGVKIRHLLVVPLDRLRRELFVMLPEELCEKHG